MQIVINVGSLYLQASYIES